MEICIYNVWNFDTFEKDNNSRGQILFLNINNQTVTQKEHECIHAGLSSASSSDSPSGSDAVLLASVCELFPGSDELLWWIVCFTQFLWHILILLSWGLQLSLKVRSVDINTSNNSKQCDEGNLCGGHSSSKHDFF